jgi:hypothetical protein
MVRSSLADNGEAGVTRHTYLFTEVVRTAKRHHAAQHPLLPVTEHANSLQATSLVGHW